MWGIIIPLLVGLAVGYFTKGKQDKSRLFGLGAIWALILAFVLNAIGWFIDVNPTTAGDDVSFVGLVLSFLVSLAVFLLGVWLGDMLEGRSGRRALPPTRPVG